MLAFAFARTKTNPFSFYPLKIFTIHFKKLKKLKIEPKNINFIYLGIDKFNFLGYTY
jgi:hypothetical protein